MPALIDAHLAHLRLASFRPASVRARRTVLVAFERTLGPRTLRDAERFDVQAFLGRDLAPESRRAYRSHLRGFYRWAMDEQLCTGPDPTEKLPPVRVPRGVPRPVPEDQMRTAMHNADPRMRAWLLLMIMAGLRCIEVAALRPEDVSETEHGPLLFLRECKGGGTGVVPAHPSILEALHALPIRDNLWWRVSRNHVSTSVGQYLRSVGVNATAHQLRHSAGTQWYKASGHDLLTTANLLRHATVQTAQIYAKVEAERPAAVVRAMYAPAPLTNAS